MLRRASIRYHTNMVDQTKTAEQVNRELFAQLRTGDTDARESLILHNLPLVRRAVERAFKGKAGMVEAMSDASGACRLALTEKIDAMKDKQGVKNPTAYLTTAIRNVALKHVIEDNLIHVPESTRRARHRVGAAAACARNR